MELEGKVAVVTGGSRGMGRATCLALAREGVSVVVNYASSEDEAGAVVRQINENGGSAIAMGADIARDSDARSLIQAAVDRWGRLDILVNNAGYTRRVDHSDLEGLTEEMMDRTLAVNVKGPIYCTRAAVPHMRRTGAGHIVNITSVAGTTGAGSSVIYGGSKAALTTITRSLARALAPEIRVNAIAPGYVDTGFGNWPSGTLEDARNRSHIGRVVTVEDVAEVVLFLVTGGRALTGQEIFVDGGTAALGRRR